MDIAVNFENIKQQIPENVKLVAISKTKPVEVIQLAYDGGQRVFGENKVQELVEKYQKLPKDIEWHMVGHLQTNKVKFIAPFVHLIHSVDSLKLLKAINKEGKKNKRIINCLMQLHIAEEETKYGLLKKELFEIFKSEEYKELLNVKVVGLMGMATYSLDENQIRKEFKGLRFIFEEAKKLFFYDKEYFEEISMGMSGDFKIAVEEGSTMVRIGSLIFGERNYLN